MNKTTIVVVAYDPRWPVVYQTECSKILNATSAFLEFEHVGSTAIPNQRAKPIIDMMAAVEQLDNLANVLETLEKLEYHVLETGMSNRLFLKKVDPATHQVFHLHIVERATWDERKERLLRDYLLTHPEAVKAQDLRGRGKKSQLKTREGCCNCCLR
ncbi:MAG: GrpB family protein [Trueperaceae bacterium]